MNIGTHRYLALEGEKVSHDDEVPAEVLESPTERSARPEMHADHRHEPHGGTVFAGPPDDAHLSARDELFSALFGRSTPGAP